MLITDKPEDLESTNALDDIEDPNPPVEPQELRLGSSTLMVMENPPHTGDYVDIAMRLRIKRTAEDQSTPDSPLTYPRYAEIVVAWPLGEQMPKPKKSKAEEDAEAEAAAADDQPALFDDDGDDGDEDYDDELAGEELADAAGVDVDGEDDAEADNVVPFNGGPAFSDDSE